MQPSSHGKRSQLDFEQNEGKGGERYVTDLASTQWNIPLLLGPGIL
jgi:hypothetical protein